MPDLPEMECCGQSDVGLVRLDNQDTILLPSEPPFRRGAGSLQLQMGSVVMLMARLPAAWQLKNCWMSSALTNPNPAWGPCGVGSKPPT